MRHASSVLSLLAIVCSVAVAAESQEPTEIPLKEIWALDMPDTRDVRELEPEAFGERAKTLPVDQQSRLLDQSFIGQIRAALKWEDNKKPKPGFAVSGVGLDALKAASEVLAGKRKASSSFSSGGGVTAVFHTLQSGSYVHVYEVERRGNLIDVRFRFVPHDDDDATVHFALIPLGKLPKGIYQVNVDLGPMETKFVDAGFKPATTSNADEIVSHSFKFSVN